MTDILVVDDVPANLVAIEAALAPLQRPVVKAHSGTEALGKLLERDFALIFLDVHMPVMDGYETARWIRMRERSRDVPIIFVTAHSHDDHAVLRGYDLAAVDFLFKPLNAEMLRAKAQVLLDFQDRMQRLVASDRRKTEFLATLAHELRNPLAPIQTAVDLMRARPDAVPSPRVVDTIHRQVRHLTHLIDDLLDVSRITANKIDLVREPIALADVIEVALAETTPMIEARHHELSVVAPPGPVAINGDTVRMVQVITNLLSNAARYTPQCGRIELAWGSDGQAAFVRVSDNGIGIAANRLDSIFEMFVQERVRVDGSGGLGLGLALSRTLVELHGGTIHATSKGRNLGATFEVRVPLLDAITERDPSAFD
jgi:signal transduction histidine kinase